VPGAPKPKPLRCTVTLGVSLAFDGVHGFDAALREADMALYRGKEGGRNRIERARAGWQNAPPRS